jgi:hypothetical protein
MFCDGWLRQKKQNKSVVWPWCQEGECNQLGGVTRGAVRRENVFLNRKSPKTHRKTKRNSKTSTPQYVNQVNKLQKKGVAKEEKNSKKYQCQT